MVCADFIIISIGQRKPTILTSEKFKISFCDIDDNVERFGNELGNKRKLNSGCEYSVDFYSDEHNYRRFNKWDAFQSLKGCMYCIYPFNDVSVEEEFFDIVSHDEKELLLPKGEKYFKSPGYVKVIKSKIFIEDIIKYYINVSPIKKIAVLFRLQDIEHEVFDGVYIQKDFLSRLKNEDLKFNVVYIVADQKQKLQEVPSRKAAKEMAKSIQKGKVIEEIQQDTNLLRS